jgi:hypothetical protein
LADVLKIAMNLFLVFNEGERCTSTLHLILNVATHTTFKIDYVNIGPHPGLPRKGIFIADIKHSRERGSTTLIFGVEIDVPASSMGQSHWLAKSHQIKLSIGSAINMCYAQEARGQLVKPVTGILASEHLLELSQQILRPVII